MIAILVRRAIGENVVTDIKIVDKSLMMIFLLEECNLSCAHCVRDDEPMDPGYSLTFEQLRMCLSDCQSLKTIEWVHFSGGEPTLWRRGKLDLVDPLVEISRAGFEPGFTTNGSFIEDYDKCQDIFLRYFNQSDKRLRLYLSIDTFHGNFDAEKGRAKCLDNVTRFKRELPPEKGELLDIKVISVISKEDESLLPDEMVEHYETLGVTFVFIPLKLMGRAKALAHLCPDLSSDEPEDLGAYHRYHASRIQKGPDEISNIVLIGNDYYFPEPWRKVARLGRLPLDIIDAYSDDI